MDKQLFDRLKASMPIIEVDNNGFPVHRQNRIGSTPDSTEIYKAGRDYFIARHHMTEKGIDARLGGEFKLPSFYSEDESVLKKYVHFQIMVNARTKFDPFHDHLTSLILKDSRIQAKLFFLQMNEKISKELNEIISKLRDKFGVTLSKEQILCMPRGSFDGSWLPSFKPTNSSYVITAIKKDE